MTDLVRPSRGARRPRARPVLLVVVVGDRLVAVVGRDRMGDLVERPAVPVTFEEPHHVEAAPRPLARHLPIARWPRHDGTYPPGLGPEVRGQAQLAQLVALGQTLAVIHGSSRAWQWAEPAAVPVSDAPLITTVLAWVPHARHLGALANLVRTADEL